jgi:hypothetical protein
MPYSNIPTNDGVMSFVASGGRLSGDDFPSSTIANAIFCVAQMCWAPTREDRPPFKDLVSTLSDMLEAVDSAEDDIGFVGGSGDVKTADAVPDDDLDGVSARFAEHEHLYSHFDETPVLGSEYALTPKETGVRSPGQTVQSIYANPT